MPNIPSASKHVRSDGKKRAHNQEVNSELKTVWKNLVTLTEKEPAKAAAYSQLVIKKYDTAASNGVIPRGRADRKKARVSALLAKLKTKKK